MESHKIMMCVGRRKKKKNNNKKEKDGKILNIKYFSRPRLLLLLLLLLLPSFRKYMPLLLGSRRLECCLFSCDTGLVVVGSNAFAHTRVRAVYISPVILQSLLRPSRKELLLLLRRHLRGLALNLPCTSE